MGESGDMAAAAMSLVTVGDGLWVSNQLIECKINYLSLTTTDAVWASVVVVVGGESVMLQA